MGLGHKLSGISSVLLAPVVCGQTMNAQWVEVANNFAGDSVPNYSAAVTTDDPTLASTPARTFDLRVSTTSPVWWCSCDLQINLPGAQTFYLSPAGSMRNPQASTWSSNPANEFSTFLCVYNFRPLLNDFAVGGWLLGKAQYPVESGVGTATLTSTQIDAAWGDVTRTYGSATVARVTILNGFDGGVIFAGRVGTANNVANQDLSYNNTGFTVARLVATANADANSDGSVDTQDFNVLAGHFGQTGALPISSGNFNGDLVVDSLDLNILIAQYGRHPASAAPGSAIPEPGSLALLSPAAILAQRRRRR
jgi:hypothetical protein